MTDRNNTDKSLPKIALDFIDRVVKNVRYRKNIRQEVRDELTDHFYMALKDCKSQEDKEQTAQELISQFGNIKQLASLIRRGKKRCRPLWRTIIARTFQVIGLFLLCFTLYCVWFFTGKPAPSIDYIDLFNERARPTVIEGENAWPYYKRAIDLYIEPDEKVEDIRDNLLKEPGSNVSDLSPEDKETLVEWIKQNEAAWSEFTAAAEKSYCFRKYAYGESSPEYEQWLITVLLPHLGEIKDLSRVAVIRSKLAVERGEYKEAINNCVTLLNVSRQWQKRYTLIESLVGMAIGKFGVSQAIEVAGTGQLSLEELTTAQGEMSEMFANGYPHVDFGGGRIFMLDAIQQTFTDSGPGGGHLLAKYTGIFLDMESEMHLIGGSLIHAGRDKTVEKVNEVYDIFDEFALMSPYQQKANGFTFEMMLEGIHEYRYMIIHIMLPALGRVCQLRYENEATYKAALTIFAIKRFQALNYGLPKDLDELVRTGFLVQTPDDPYSAGSLVYRPDGSDFTLYSVGSDFIDDGGIHGTRKGKYKLWGDQGDTVFWPVMK
jgi:hypothetical protein